MLFAKTGSEALDQATDRIDGERSLTKAWWGGRQMDGSEFIEAHHMVDDDDLGRNFAETSSSVLERRFGLGWVDLVEGVVLLHLAVP